MQDLRNGMIHNVAIPLAAAGSCTISSAACGDNLSDLSLVAHAEQVNPNSVHGRTSGQYSAHMPQLGCGQKKYFLPRNSSRLPSIMI